LGLAVLSVVTAACASTSSTSSTSAGGSTSSSTTPATAADCAAAATLVNPGTLTIGTSNPAYPPYFDGGAPSGSEWKINDPSTGKGFESAVAYDIAKQMGFTADQVQWVPVKFDQSYAPGPKTYDFDINEISITAKRAEAVDFSDPYYQANQGLVIVKGTPIASATSVADLQQYTLAAPIGTTSYDLIKDYIGAKVGVYQSQADAVAALNAGQVDGLVVDYPTALYMADPYVQEVKNSTILAQFPTSAVQGGDQWGTTQAKGSSLTQCIDLALKAMQADGSLQAIQTQWLSKKTNVGEVPVWSK
jgi:polar amino acid transport system substrate-binding protein